MPLKTKSLEQLEKRMEAVEESSLRYQILQNAKNFKTSWISLGQALYSVSKDKLYKDWGYMTFEAYTSREIGIKKATAIKLLKSYYFLEQEESGYLHKDYADSSKVASTPNYEAVNLLRLAKNKKTLTKDDYDSLKKDVLETGKDASELRKDLTSLMKQRAELDPEEARKKRKITVVKRFLTILKTLKTDLEISKIVSANLIRETADLINKIETELS